MSVRPSTLPLVRPALCGGLLLVLFVLAPEHARAWTDATVRSARATVVLEDGARVRVSMTVELRVDGGWLEAFELDGLDAGLVLDPEHPPTFVRHVTVADADTALATAAPPTETLSPRVTSHERGRIGFAFSRRQAPRRGDYRVELTYVAPLSGTPLAHPDGSRLDWTFPAWRFGLDAVEVDLVLPAGSIVEPAFLAAAEGDAGIVIESLETDEGLARLHFVRHHLPRTRSWELGFVVPASVAPVPVIGSAARPLEPSVVLEPVAEAFSRATLAGVFGLLLLVLGKNAVLRREGHESGHAEPRWVGFFRTLAAVGALGASVVLSVLAPTFVPVAIAVLGLAGAHGSSGAPDACASGSFRPASAAWVRAARVAHRRARRGLSAWLRLGNPRGAAVVGLSAMLTLVVSRELPEELPAHHASVLIAACLVVFSSRARSGAETPLLSLGTLLELARRMRLLDDERVSVALAPVVFVDDAGRVRAARIRIVVPTPPPGLLRLDIVTSERGASLVAVARAGSEAAARLEGLAPLAKAARERVGFVLPAGADLGVAVSTLALAVATPARDATPQDASTSNAAAAAA